MERRKRMSGLMGAVAGFALLLAACNGGGNGNGDPGDGEETVVEGNGADMTVGVVPKALDQEFWFAFEDGAVVAAEDLGVDLILDGAVAETAIEEQIAIIEDMMTRGVDALAVAPTAPDQLEPVLQQATDDGIPVLLVDTDIPEWDGKLSFIGTDNITAGGVGAEYVAEAMDGSGTIAILEGLPGATSGEHRVQGFTETLEELAPDIEIVASLPGDWDRAEAISVTEDILTANPDVEAIFAANDQMALGALQALNAAGIDPADVLVVGFDGTPEAAESILDGGMDASVAQLPDEMGRIGVEEGVAAAQGEDVEEIIDTGAELVTEDNAAEYAGESDDESGEDDDDSDEDDDA